ncbi:non-hydrolyzing UDP-N-acetylglucosamine 2-epimerase [Adhaeretor mobilis]|uniref:UDP-2,3-diacetamido-2,3-dideoxy-D-glucuronate 2-epimerase n=1 Tax=Adhaeretor mobilis TaxID=1930276 RepID=A0A517MPZ4_9BACT|nr:UDP-N-acetylglucosamine 2-epimerase (non-hydrolyzing) [Adhaeretor mobilis]QDS96951.1 UDP-2,3-diacetamido-2,3-dideoxy-D-glucuronate 2-epimerase [Adhaeretor mobilis]
MKIICIAGARPNFMKIAPIMEAFHSHSGIEPLLVHTGQHYDEKMSNLFFRELGIPEPDINLEVGSGSHAVQTAEIMRAFEPVCIEHAPNYVLVVGDVNSTIACGLVAVKLGIKLIHVEAGLRSGDRRMPEEINRLLTDSISDLLFCTERSGVENLRREGVAAERVHLVGNVMIDTLLKNREKAERSTILADMGLEAGGYATMTLHRPSNVDNPKRLSNILDAIDHIQRDLPIVFPIHPRTRKNVSAFSFEDRVKSMKNLHVVEPIGYLDFLKLNASAKLVLTDSGGLQEETTILKVPCITIRENTERPVTCDIGSNQLVGTSTDAILGAYERIASNQFDQAGIPGLWDGKAASRIASILIDVDAQTMSVTKP